MRILQICSGLTLLRGGAEGFCISLSERLCDQGHEVILATGESSSEDLPSGSIMTYTLPEETIVWKRKLLRDYHNPNSVKSFLQLLDKIHPDVVHFHSFYGLPAILGSLSSQSLPTVITLHDSWAAFYDGAIIEPKLWLTNNVWKLPLAILHRAQTEKFFQNSILVSPSLWLKHFFVEHTKFPTPLHIKNAISNSAEYTSYQKEILWVGDISPHKGLQNIISTIDDIARQHQWQVTIVGDGPLRNELTSLYPNVRFIGYADPKLQYLNASIFIMSSICWENCPTVLLEAMQYGLCVIGNNLAGIEEIVSHGQTGLLYNSPHELGSLLSRTINDPTFTKTLGQAGRSFVTNEYPWSQCVESYCHLYQKLINSDIRNT